MLLTLRELSNLKARNLKKETLTKIYEEEFISKATHLFRKTDVLAVSDKKGEINGILTRKKIIRAGIDPTKTKVKNIQDGLFSLNQDSGFLEVVKLFNANNIKPIAITKNGKVFSFIRNNVILEKISLSELSNLSIDEIMKLNPTTIFEDETIARAIKLFKDKHISRLPVLNKKNEIIGIVTISDIVTKYFYKKQRARRGEKSGEKINVLRNSIIDVMQKNVVVGLEDETLGNAIKKILKNKIGGLPVINRQGKVTGVITRKDIMKYLEQILERGKIGPRQNIQIVFRNLGKDEQVLEKGFLRSKLQKILRKFSLGKDVQISLNVKRKKGRSRRKGLFEGFIRLISDKTAIFAKADAFGIRTMMDRLEDKIKKQIKKEKGKHT